MSTDEQATEVLGLPVPEDVSSAVVVVWKGGHVVRETPETGCWVLGRGADADLRIDHPSVSRRHASIFFDSPMRIQDHGSANGTRLNGARIAEGEMVPIPPGAAIEVGIAVLLFRPAGESLRGSGIASDVVVRDPAMLRTFELAEVVAKSRLTVLVLGETGVGKEVLARRIHEASPRAKNKLVTLNCAALTETLLESELFGYERGAFTGATRPKVGVIEAAHRGTLFLDEVGELSPATQAKLLRVLEQGAVTPVGSVEARTVDVRFICATHCDLQAMVREGKFREDLYFRLDGMTIRVPPLRERPADVLALAEHFLVAAAHEAGRPPPTLSKATSEKLSRHAWPGNVREMKNVLVRSLLFCKGSVLEEADLQLGPSAPPDRVQETQVADDDPRKTRVLQALEATRWNQTRAAKELGISRRTLYNWMEDLGIEGAASSRNPRKP